MPSFQKSAKIISNEELSAGLFRLTMEVPEIAAAAKPGQFVMVKAGEKGTPLLRRPFSIHQVADGGLIQLLIKVVGKGTSYLADRRSGEALELIGPLGHGFSLPGPNDIVCIIGGGVGIAPLYFLVKGMLGLLPVSRIKVLLGSCTARELLTLSNDFANFGIHPVLATDDGTAGHHGFVTDLLVEQFSRDEITLAYACGPEPMMSKVAGLCHARNCPCQVSLETVMACGISACLGCTIKSSQAKLQSGGRPYLHVCKDGPVFDAGDVAWL